MRAGRSAVSPLGRARDRDVELILKSRAGEGSIQWQLESATT